MNWYEYLKQIPDVEAIAVKENNYLYEDKTIKTGFFKSVEEAKELLNYDFDDGYGGAEGPYFTLWTKDRVYFPATYDGSEWVSWVPRHPCNDATSHIGGG